MALKKRSGYGVIGSYYLICTDKVKSFFVVNIDLRLGGHVWCTHELTGYIVREILC